MSFRDELDHESFGRDFLDLYLADGFTSLSKKEIDLAVLRLLLRHAQGWSEDRPPSAFELAQPLRVKRGRIRSMLDELSYRRAPAEDELAHQLREILVNGEKDLDGRRVKIQVEDAYLREYAKSLVQKDLGLVDSSFDRSIISLSGNKFLALVGETVDPKTKRKIEAEINKHQRKSGAAAGENPLKDFLMEVVKGAGNEIGKKTVQVGFAALTGGLSEIPGLISSIFASKDDHENGE